MRAAARRALAAASIAMALRATSACVPATEELRPRGALLVRTEPSPAARGAPMITADGWTVYVEDLVLMILLSAAADEVGSGDTQERLVRGSAPTETLVRAIQAGPALAQARLTRWRVGRPREATEIDEGISEEVVARFARTGDGERAGTCGGIPANFRVGPSVSVRVRAERDGRVVRLDLAVLRGLLPAVAQVPAVVAPNQSVPATVPIVAERLFTDDDGVIRFDAFAAADTDGDGFLTPDELCDALTPPLPGDAGDGDAEAGAADADAGVGDAEAPDGDTGDVGAPDAADAGDAGSRRPPLLDTLRTRASRLLGP